ncbi:MAG: amidohydrolase family protein, partial [Tepidisphaeraceae bacterium]
MFENANVFDGVSPKLAEGMSVLVDGNEINTVARALPSEGTERIDCRGKTLMPGMIDNHLHIYAHSLQFMPPDPPITYRAQYAHKFLTHILSCGFTAVRDMAGGDHGMAMALRDRYFDGPRFFYGGLALSQTGGHGDFRSPDQPTDYLICAAERNVYAIMADGVDACMKAAREELRKGATHIK